MPKPKDQVPIQSFTTTHNGIARELTSETIVFPAFDPTKVNAEPPGKNYSAIWDTGATNTVITKKVVDELELKPIGMRKVTTASQTVDAAVYMINIKLPSNVGIALIKVTESVSLGGKSDLLIGMDIISMGDFAVTNLNRNTVFSFRFPSIEKIDFVKEQKEIKKPSPKTKGGASCPCGSGKKFKNCCRNK